jgi:hypothetical protein
MKLARLFLLSLCLAGCDLLYPPPEPRVTKIDIYADHFEYRTRSYETPTALGIGLQAARQEPEVIELHDCGRRAVLEDVIDVVRASGHYSFSVVVPDDC